MKRGCLSDNLIYINILLKGHILIFQVFIQKKGRSMQQEQDSVYKQLIALHDETFAGGFYETAYHILAAALHRAQDIDSEYLLGQVEELAQQDMVFIDQHYPKHNLSSQSAQARATNPLYRTLAKHELVRRTLIIALHQRNPQKRGGVIIKGFLFENAPSI